MCSNADESFNCLYCGEDKPSAEASLEHAIPQFMGGNSAPRQYLLRNVCEGCNNKLGLFVDASYAKSWFFTNHLVTASRRLYSGLQDQPLPLCCIGLLKAENFASPDGYVAEIWLGPSGETIIWTRKHDERVYWYSGGKVSRTEYARLVVDEVAGKRWLHHPSEALLRQQAAVTLSQHAAERNREIDQRREQETELAKFQKIPESLQRIIPPPSERTTTGSYPRKPRTHHWKHGPVSTANSVQWRTCGCTQWEDVLRYAQERRAEHQTVAIALRMCSERYGYSISLLVGIWMSAGLIQ